MPLVVERTFETAGNIVTGAVSLRRHRFGSSEAPAPRTTNEEQVVIEFHAERPKLAGKALSLGGGTVTAVTYEYGNTFLIVAGLLNLLVVCDAWDLVTGRK